MAFLEQELITESVALNMLSWPHSGFNVYLGPVIAGDDREQLKQTARYSARAPLALSRLTYKREQELISYTYTNPYDHTELAKEMGRTLTAGVHSHLKLSLGCVAEIQLES
jgi:hypothetical protein